MKQIFRVVFLSALAACGSAVAAPHFGGEWSAPRASGYVPCPAPYDGSSQPSMVDCIIEGGDGSYLPNDQLYSVVQGRIGGASDYELSIQDATLGASPLTTREFTWVSDTPYTFKVSFDPSTRVVTFRLGGIQFSATPSYSLPRKVTDIFVRTTTTLPGTGVAVRNLSVTQGGVTTAFPGAESSVAEPLVGGSGNGLVSYVWLAGFDGNSAFELDGIATYSFAPGTPNLRGSRVAFQIKLGEAHTPEPATFGLGAVALGGFAWVRLRRRTR